MSIGGLVVTHGSLGESLVAEATRLVGEHESFTWMATAGISAEEIRRKLRTRVGSDPWIIFVDSPGTGPAVCAQDVIGEGQAVVTGVNLAMLLSFLIHRDRYDSVGELARRMVRDGSRALEVLWSRDPPHPRD